MIKSLMQRGADVCILRTPVDETYLNLTSDKPDFIKSIKLFKSIAEKTTARYVDFQDLEYQFTLDKFLNQDHITPRASFDFSRQVNSAYFNG